MEKYEFNPKDGQTILEPEGKGKGYWIGAPFVYYDEDLKKFFLYVRLRNPRPKVGKVNPQDTRRGYKCQILESDNGINFKVIWETRKHQINARSIEGAALIKIGKKYRIFQSYESPKKVPRWKIKTTIADHPSKFNYEHLEPVDWDLSRIKALSIKDPLIYKFGKKFFLYIDYFRVKKKPFGSTGVLTSLDGKKFKWEGDIFVKHKGTKCEWASLLIRLTGIFQENPNRYIGFFDGTDEREKICDEKAGILEGRTPYKFRIISSDAPKFSSEYGSGSVRYLFALPFKEEIWIYYEYSEKQGEHVLKLYKIKN